MANPPDAPSPRQGMLHRFGKRLGNVLLARNPQPHYGQARLDRFLAFRHAVAQVVAHTEQEQVLLDALCTLAIQSTTATLAWVCRPDAQGNFSTLAEAGRVEYLDEFAHPRTGLPIDQGPLNRVWREQPPLFNAAFPEGPLRRAWEERARKFSFRSIAVLPISRDGKPWALFALYDPAARAFPSDCQIVLQSILRQVTETLEDWCDILQEREQAKQQSILGAALKASDEGVILTDAERHVLYTNPSFSMLTGYLPAEITRLGMHVLQGPLTDPEALREIDAALHAQTFYNGTLLNYRRDGRTFWNHLSLIPIHSPEGALTHYVGMMRDVTEERQALHQLEYDAYHDRLTGIGNRRSLEDQVEVSLLRAQRQQSRLAVCMIDLDHFKPINDLYGHDAGDHVLRVISRRLQEKLRRTDYVARIGGDEFVLLIEGYNTRQELEIILTKIEGAVTGPIYLKTGERVGVQLSMGVSLYHPPYRPDFTTLLQAADQALYQSKAQKGQREHYWIIVDGEPA